METVEAAYDFGINPHKRTPNEEDTQKVSFIHLELSFLVYIFTWIGILLPSIFLELLLYKIKKHRIRKAKIKQQKRLSFVSFLSFFQYKKIIFLHFYRETLRSQAEAKLFKMRHDFLNYLLNLANKIDQQKPTYFSKFLVNKIKKSQDHQKQKQNKSTQDKPKLAKF